MLAFPRLPALALLCGSLFLAVPVRAATNAVIPAAAPRAAATPAAATPVVASPSPPAHRPGPIPGYRVAAALSLARLLAPVLQLKLEYGPGDKLVVGALVGYGSPPRDGLSEYSQTELGAFAGYYALGTSSKGLGAVVQARGYLSDGRQDGEDGSEAFVASGSGVSIAALLSARRVFGSSLLLQADYGITRLWSRGEATSAGKTRKAEVGAWGSLLNVWVGLTF